jgi:hypothetical protein
MQILQHAFRTYVDNADLDGAIALYEGLEQMACERRVTISETRIEAAKVGHFLILSGDPESLAKVRHVDAIFYVDDLDAFDTWLRPQGVEILHAPQAVTGGRNLTARHPDGLVVEYFEARS